MICPYFKPNQNISKSNPKDIIFKDGMFVKQFPIECERINCFPDNWTNTGMTDKKRYFMMGNALVVGIIEKNGEELSIIIDKEA